MRPSLALTLVGLLAALGSSCGGDSYERPAAAPGRIVTVVDTETLERAKAEPEYINDVVAGPDGTLYVTASTNRAQLLAIPRKGNPRLVATSAYDDYPKPTILADLRDLTLDPQSGTLYAADRDTGMIVAVDRDGTIRHVARMFGALSKGLVEGLPGETAVMEGSPRDVVFDPRSGYLYATNGCQIVRFKDRRGSVVDGAGLADGTVELVATECGASEGKVPRLLPPPVGERGGGWAAIAVDPISGDVLVARTARGSGEVSRIDQAGVVSSVFSGPGESTPEGDREVSSTISAGAGLAVSAAGEAVFSDPVQGVVVRVGRDGTAVTLARIGANPAPGAADAGVEGTLKQPMKVAVDADGNVFVTSGDGLVVQVIGAT